VVHFPLAEISHPPARRAGKPPEDERSLARQLERIILQRFRPACVTVKENGDSVYFSGLVRRYLEQPTGSPDTNVINMAPEGLRGPLRSLLHRPAMSREKAEARTPLGVGQLQITVEPLAEFRDAPLFMILFEEATIGPPRVVVYA